MSRQKRRQIFEAWFLQYGQVAAVYHAQSARAGGNDQSPEIAVQLGGAPGEIDGSDLGAGGEEIDDGIDGFGRHLFRATWSRIHVTVHTALVAAVAKVQLQRLDGAALQARKISAGEKVQSCMHGGCSERSCPIGRRSPAR